MMVLGRGWWWCLWSDPAQYMWVSWWFLTLETQMVHIAYIINSLWMQYLPLLMSSDSMTLRKLFTFMLEGFYHSKSCAYINESLHRPFKIIFWSEILWNYWNETKWICFTYVFGGKNRLKRNEIDKTFKGMHFNVFGSSAVRHWCEQ